MGWCPDGMNPARRTVLTANSAICCSGSRGPRQLRWLGMAKCTARVITFAQCPVLCFVRSPRIHSMGRSSQTHAQPFQARVQ